MISMEMMGKIRRMYFGDKLSLYQIRLVTTMRIMRLIGVIVCVEPIHNRWVRRRTVLGLSAERVARECVNFSWKQHYWLFPTAVAMWKYPASTLEGTWIHNLPKAL